MDLSMDYFAMKLTSDGRSRGHDDARAFDAEATCREFKRVLCQARREYAQAGFYNRMRYKQGLTAELARDLWDALGGDLSSTDDVTLFCERFLHLDGHEWISEEPWEDAIYTPTTSFMVLRNAILPALRDAAMEVVVARRPKQPSIGWAGDFALREFEREDEAIGDCPLCEFGGPLSFKREVVTERGRRAWVSRWTCGHWIVQR